MAKSYGAPLDRAFAVLADPTRRAQLDAEGVLPVSDPGKPLTMSLPAVTKHIDVPKGAGLIARRKTGRTVACRLTAAPLESAARWLRRCERFWTEGPDRLAVVPGPRRTRMLGEDGNWREVMRAGHRRCRA